MHRVKSFVGAVIIVMVLSTGALAGSQALTFDSNNWGTGTWGTYNTIKSFESSGGNLREEQVNVVNNVPHQRAEVIYGISPQIWPQPLPRVR